MLDEEIKKRKATNLPSCAMIGAPIVYRSYLFQTKEFYHMVSNLLITSEILQLSINAPLPIMGRVNVFIVDVVSFRWIFNNYN